MLCGQPAIAISEELRDFLAYGDDGSLAFANKNQNLKIDKVRKNAQFS